MCPWSPRRDSFTSCRRHSRRRDQAERRQRAAHPRTQPMRVRQASPRRLTRINPLRTRRRGDRAADLRAMAPRAIDEARAHRSASSSSPSSFPSAPDATQREDGPSNGKTIEASSADCACSSQSNTARNPADPRSVSHVIVSFVCVLMLIAVVADCCSNVHRNRGLDVKWCVDTCASAAARVCALARSAECLTRMSCRVCCVCRVGLVVPTRMARC